MKKTLVLFALVFTIANTLSAQVPNANFELLNADGTLRNWGSVYITSGTSDTDGNFHLDSIQVNNYFYCSSTDAHTGSRALEINNGHNFTAGYNILGTAGADNDSVFTAFGSFDYIPVTVAPANFSFYYKFFPVGNDSAVGTLTVYDSFMSELGNATIIMNGTVSSYTYATKPVTIMTPGTVAYMSVNFKNSTLGHTPNSGTRLLIDDINDSPTSINLTESNHYQILCYPTIATDHVNLSVSGITHATLAHISVYDISGKLLEGNNVTLNTGVDTRLNVVNYPCGMYLVDVIIEGYHLRSRFIK